MFGRPQGSASSSTRPPPRAASAGGTGLVHRDEESIERKLQEGLQRLEDARSLVSAAAARGGATTPGAASARSQSTFHPTISQHNKSASHNFNISASPASSVGTTQQHPHIISSNGPTTSRFGGVAGGSSSSSVRATPVRPYNQQIDLLNSSTASHSLLHNGMNNGGGGAPPLGGSGTSMTSGSHSTTSIVSANHAAWRANGYDPQASRMALQNLAPEFNISTTFDTSINHSVNASAAVNRPPFFATLSSDPDVVAGKSLLERTKPEFLRNQEGRIKQMEYEIKVRRLEDEVEGLSKHSNDYQAKLEKTQEQLHNTRHEAQVLQRENEIMLEKTEQLEEELNRVQAFADGYSSEKKDFEENVKNLENQVTVLTASEETLTKELTAIKAHATELEQECTGQSAEVVQLRQKLEETQAALCAATNRCESYHAESSSLRSDLDAQKALQVQLEYQLQLERNKSDKARQDKKRSADTVSELRSELSELEQQAHILEAQLEHSHTRNADLCKELTVSGSTGVKVKSRAAKWAKEVEALHKWKGKALITIHALQSEVKQIQGKYQKYLQYAHKLHQEKDCSSTRDVSASSASVGATTAQQQASAVYPPAGGAANVTSKSVLLPNFSNPLLAASLKESRELLAAAAAAEMNQASSDEDDVSFQDLRPASLRA
ncbi:unnamed protein product [Amoebophrya sp. A120]|nr:unnamed protein product [Amoebophrya sp. A120]|eukprot:GSA120T00023620001.1